MRLSTLGIGNNVKEALIKSGCADLISTSLKSEIVIKILTKRVKYVIISKTRGLYSENAKVPMRVPLGTFQSLFVI